jgi:hypothetical protein
LQPLSLSLSLSLPLMKTSSSKLVHIIGKLGLEQLIYTAVRYEI